MVTRANVGKGGVTEFGSANGLLEALSSWFTNDSRHETSWRRQGSKQLWLRFTFCREVSFRIWKRAKHHQGENHMSICFLLDFIPPNAWKRDGTGRPAHGQA